MGQAPPNLLRSIACIIAALTLCDGVYSLGVRAYADMLVRSSVSADVDRALELAPDNAAYWLRRADLLERDMSNPVPALEAASELNPLDADVWVRLGLEAEARGEHPKAESCFLQAARVSRRYQPRWTLANYYFRRGSGREFWKWTRQALELEPGSPAALFQLCWKMSADPVEILEKGIPRSRNVWRNYGRFLLAQNQIEAAGNVIRQLLADAQADDRDLLIEACDRFLGSRAINLASAVWNTLCERKLLSCRVMRPLSGESLNDDALDARALGHGFAWHIGSIPGLTAALRPGLTMVDFSGREPENAEVLWRWIPVMPRQELLLRFEYQTSGISPDSGLVWQVLGGEDPQSLGSSPSLSNPAWTEGVVRFEVPAGVELLRLRLSYTRLPGEPRIEGSLSTRAIRLEVVR
jgi:tetratricopeptide (TPR) repeat protein